MIVGIVFKPQPPLQQLRFRNPPAGERVVGICHKYIIFESFVLPADIRNVFLRLKISTFKGLYQSNNAILNRLIKYSGSILALVGSLSSTPVIGQADSNRLFLNSKGYWICPLPRYNRVITDDQTHYNGGCGRVPGITFFGDSALPVRAVFAGEIISIFQVADEYAIMTRFGDYCIIYAGSIKPIFKKGDKINTGQIIAYMNEENSNDNELEMMISDIKGRYIDPEKWFHWRTSGKSPGNILVN